MKIIAKFISIFGLLIYQDDWTRLEILTKETYYQYNQKCKGMISEVLVQTLIIAEDRRFYQHYGMDPRAILRALWRIIFKKTLEGATTVTQQLVRTLLNEKEITIKRKIKEICLATLFERIIPKYDIPKLYLSVAYFGWGMQGIQEACFKKNYNINNLTLEQAASLIARLKYPEPNKLSEKRIEKIKKREDYLVKQMLKSNGGDRKLVKPFPVSEKGLTLKGQYLDPNVLLSSLLDSTIVEKKSILRLWITEGIPFAFRKYPMIYEEIRVWLAESLNINEKEITIIGSARTGYSLSSYPKYGYQYNKDSDLDFSIISNDLFDRLSSEFNKWIVDYSNMTVKPRNETEQKYWEKNKQEVPGHIRRGFIDSNKVPYWDSYPTAQKMGQTTYVLKERIKMTKDAPETDKVTIRVYKNWDDFIKQLLINLDFMIKSFEKIEIEEQFLEVSAALEEIK
jgi:hypothetical protein